MEELIQLTSKLSIQSQVQKHGFDFENDIRTNVFELKSEVNNRDIHDIPAKHNKFNDNENISIKLTSKKNCVECGDILRFFEYNFDQKNTIIVGKYKQIGNIKKIYEIIEIDYTKEFHTYLFGSITKELLEKYIRMIKAIPKENYTITKDDKEYYLDKKRELQKEHSMKIIIHPKVDTSGQRRVQCSIPFVEKFILSKSENVIRGVTINDIVSPPRKRN
jgi:hypothetical protein